MICVICNITKIESNRKQSAIEKTLRAHDRISKAENQRRQFANISNRGGRGISVNLVHGLSFGSGCRCCYDPNTDGGDYELLAEAKHHEYLRANHNDSDEHLEEDAIYEQDDTERYESTNKLSNNIRDDDNDDENGSSDDSEFDYLLDEDIPGSTTQYDMQGQRRAELETLARQIEILRHHGYGVHRQMHPQRLFSSAGYGTDTMRDVVRPQGSVVHLFDAYSQKSVALDLYLEKIACKYPGTKFVRGLGVASVLYAHDGGSDDGAWKRGELPMLLALREGKVVAWNAGLNDFFDSGGGNSYANLDSRSVEQWLDRAGVLVDTPPSIEEICRIRPEETALLENMMKLNTLGDDRGYEEEERYDCGVAGCNKSFQHEHVGVKTDAQHGLLVTEDQVVSSQEIS
jgi:hypothetical protein